MAHSIVAQAHMVPCPACSAEAGQFCWPRQPDDSPWVHKDRDDLFTWVLSHVQMMEVR